MSLSADTQLCVCWKARAALQCCEEFCSAHG
jgi:hypothetical protein